MLGDEGLGLVFEEDEADHVFQRLGVGILLQPFLAQQRARAGDVVLSITAFRHDLARAPGVKLLQFLPPCEIGDAAFRIGLARNGPAFDVLGTRGNLQGLRRIRRETVERGTHPLAVEFGPACRIGGVGGIDEGESPLQSVGHAAHNGEDGAAMQQPAFATCQFYVTRSRMTELTLSKGDA